MIAPKNPGRNEPCSCGSGRKWKLCCGDPDIKALRQENLRLKTLAHLFLSQLQGLTGKAGVVVPMATLAQYPADAKIEMVRAGDVFRFSIKQEQVIGPRRILLPG